MQKRHLLQSLPRCLLSALLVAGLTTSAVNAVDGDPPGLFELDGNTLDSGPGDDWDSLFNANQSGSPTAFTGILADPSPLTIYTQGGSKDVNDVSEWRYRDGSVPDKDDITNAYAAAYTVAPEDATALHKAGDLILYFGLDRFANNGDAFAGFWFFQNDVGLGPNGTFQGTHVARQGVPGQPGYMPGDLLVLVEYPQGSNATPEIKVYEWDPANTGAPNVAPNLEEIFSSADAKCDATGSKLACAITNVTNLPDQPGVPAPAWPYTPKNGFAGIPFESFFEGGINVTQLLGGVVPCFSSFLAETRSSRSETAQLKDFVLGDFDLCSIAVTKECTAAIEEGDSILVNFNGEVTNDGGLTLHDVTVTDDMGTPDDATDDTVVFGPADLQPGETQPYNGSYSTTDVSPTDVVIAEGHRANATVSATAEASCAPDIEPELAVDKQCTAVLNESGDGIVVSFNGTVSNTGNVDLEDVEVVDDNGTPGNTGDDVTIPIGDLAVGESKPYNGGFSASGASSTDNVTASGSDVLSGTPVQATASASCAADLNPEITVDKLCTAAVNSSGSGIDVLFSGTVTNTGDVALTNVTVVDDNGTPGNTGDDVQVLGPIDLAPGASAPYNGGFSASGASSTDNVTASGSDVLTQTPVSDTASASCAADVTPDILVTKECTATINSSGNGIDVLFSGTVSNTGNVTLTNVTVVDDHGTPGNTADDVQVLGPIDLAPGASAPYNGSFAASGASSTDSVTASGSDVLTQSPVSDTASASCAADVNPAIAVDKLCTAAVNSSGSGIDVLFSGTVTNTGDVVLTNVTVVDDSGTPGDTSDDVQVLGPIDLAPGASAPYNGGFSASGASSSDTVTASGSDVLTQSPVSDTGSASCAADVNPDILVTKVCTASLNSSGSGIDVLFNGTVTNTGNVTLTNVTVVDDHGTPGNTGDDVQVLGPIDLAPGASAPYNGGFASSGSSSTDTVTASGSDVLTQSPVSDTDSASCAADVSPAIAVTKQCIDAPAFGQPILFDGTVTNTGNVLLLDVAVTDDNGTPGDTSDDVVFSLGDLAPGASAPYNGSYSPALAGPSTNTVVATASDAVESTPVQATDNATCVVPPPDQEGCTPGFWKNSVGSWAPTGYSPNQTVSSVFTLPNGVLANQLGGNSLLQALGYPGGTNLVGAAQILLRAAVASVLNASHPEVDDFPRTAAEVIADVNAALATKDRATILALASALDADNNLGCDLPNDNSF